MNFNELYYRRPYDTEFDGEVTSCEPGANGLYEVVLDRTLFYPEGGGQPADIGTLNGIFVRDVQIVGGRIIHYAEAPLESGSSVHGIIDWNHRFDLMQEHTGEHIVSGLIHQKFGYDNVGFHMSDVVTLDLNGDMSWDDVMEIEREANRVVYSNVPVIVLLPSKSELATLQYRRKKDLQGPVRIIKIPGADSCACCGMHVQKTGEIGLIKILSLTKYKGGVRLEMLAGRRALADYGRRTDETIALSHMLSAKQNELVDAVQKILSESAEKDRRIAEINMKYFRLKSVTFPEDQKEIVEFEPDLNIIEIRKYCDLLNKNTKAVFCAVFTGSDEDGYHYAIGSSSLNLRDHVKELNEALKGRGGGSPVMIQGTFHATEEEIRNVLQQKLSPRTKTEETA